MCINILLKTIHWRDRRPNLVIFVGRRALIVGRWVVLGQSNISSFCFRCESRACGGGLNSRFSFVVPGMERYSLDPPQTVENRGYALEAGCGGCTWIVNA